VKNITTNKANSKISHYISWIFSFEFAIVKLKQRIEYSFDPNKSLHTKCVYFSKSIGLDSFEIENSNLSFASAQRIVEAY